MSFSRALESKEREKVGGGTGKLKKQPTMRMTKQFVGKNKGEREENDKAEVRIQLKASERRMGEREN